MLKNASSLAIVGLDTAENGPSKVRQVTTRIDAIIEEERGDLFLSPFRIPSKHRPRREQKRFFEEVRDMRYFQKSALLRG